MVVLRGGGGSYERGIPYLHCELEGGRGGDRPHQPVQPPPDETLHLQPLIMHALKTHRFEDRTRTFARNTRNRTVPQLQCVQSVMDTLKIDRFEDKTSQNSCMPGAGLISRSSRRPMKLFTCSR